MKYLFKNIGPIKEAELELGDLTVIAGGNNAGKTYISYTLHRFRMHIRVFFLRNMRKIGESHEKKFSDTENQEGVVRGSIPSNVLVQCVQKTIELSAKSFRKEDIADIFAAPKEMFSQPSVGIVTEKFNLPKNFHVSDIEINVMGNAKITLSEVNGIVKYEVEFDANSKLVLDESSETKSHFAHAFIIRAILRWHFGIMFDFILPAERFDISLFYKELDFAKSRLIESLQKWSYTDKRKLSRTPLMLSGESARYGLTISDHIDWTRNLDKITKQTSPLSKDKLFDNIKQMIDGYYRHDENQIFFISGAKGKPPYEMPLHMASSSVRELSSIYFYLKHQARLNRMIIVDEPESHLDTENQIKMARLLAQCVNSGVRVLITTHSDYIVQELNNMIMLHSAPKNEKIRQLQRKQGYKEHHILDKSKVKGYLCKDGGLVSCAVNDRGMNLQWFENTIEEINSVSETLGNAILDEGK